MTTLNIYSGPLKRDIIQIAFEECGQAGYEFELTAEEYDSALRRLNGLMAELEATYGVALNYNQPPYGNGSATEESGLPPEAMRPVGLLLALEIAPSIGKELSPQTKGRASEARQSLISRFAVIPMRELGRQTPRGAGNKWLRGGRPYFVTTTSPREVEQ